MRITIAKFLSQTDSAKWRFESAEVISDPQIVRQHVRDFPIRNTTGYRSETNHESSAEFFPSQFARLKEVAAKQLEPGNRNANWHERQQTEARLIAAEYEPFVDWYIENFNFRSTQFDKWNQKNVRAQLNRLLLRNENYAEFLSRLEKLAESMLASDNHSSKDSVGWLKQLDQESLAKICWTTVESSATIPVRCAVELAALEPSENTLDLLRKGIGQTPENRRWVRAVSNLLNQQNDPVLQSKTVELIKTTFGTSPDLNWLACLAKSGNHEVRPWVLQQLKTLKLNSLVCRVAYDLGADLAIEFYTWALASGHSNAARHVAHGIQDCIYDVPLENLPIVKWAIQNHIGSECIEFVCEAWWMEHGFESAKEQIVPELKRQLLPETPANILLMIVKSLGQLLRGDCDDNTIALIRAVATPALLEALKPHEFANFVRSIRLIGGSEALDLCKRVLDACLLEKLNGNQSLLFEKRWYEKNLTQADLCDFLLKDDFASVATVEDVYQQVWEEHNDRRLSAPSLGIWPLGDAELSLHLLAANGVGFITEYFEMDTLTALNHFESLAGEKLKIESLHVAQAQPDDQTQSASKKQNESVVVEMVVNDELIRVPCANDPEICDPAEIADLLNALLAKAKTEQRFFATVPMDDQVCLLFGTAEWKSKLSEQFCFPFI